jgi:arabinosaccharide transport system substrate-binding protein
MALLAAGAALVSAVWAPRSSSGREFWLFAGAHHRMYTPILEGWNASGAPPRVEMRLLSFAALQRRMLSSFFSGTPSADLIEVERGIAGRAFTGPLDRVGFTDLTDRLRAEGLLEKINAPSFGPWTTRGRVFGLPHDVHPVMLGYRADLAEAAGIDLSNVETWDDFFTAMRPLMRRDAEGRRDRFILNMSPTNADHLEVLLLQAGGGLFDPSDRCTIKSPANARVLAAVARWCAGPDPVAADAPNFDMGGNQKKADGYVLASFFPDWMCDIWRHEIPTLSGKMRLMPIPAWTRGGARTSVWGGTMLGIPRTAAKTPEDFEELWAFAKKLYLSRELARELWTRGSIISPVKENWSDPIYDQPEPYFGGQATGRLYIGQAPHIPTRASSPFNTIALQRTQAALEALATEYRAHQGWTQDQLEARALELLGGAQSYIEEQIRRNVFLAEGAGGGA